MRFLAIVGFVILATTAVGCTGDGPGEATVTPTEGPLPRSAPAPEPVEPAAPELGCW